MKVKSIFRNPKVGYSIQRVFQTINAGICEAYDIEEVFLPDQRSSIKAIFKNGFFARNHQGRINQITGDTHYLVYFLKNKNTVVTVHDIMYYSYLSGLKKKLWKVLYIDVLKKARKVVFISEFARDQVLKEIDLPVDQFCVIPNPVSEDFVFESKIFNNAKPVILHINGNLERKNLARTIQALDGIPCHLRIVGKLSSEISKVLANANIEYSNVFDLSNEDVVNEYKNCDIVNFPSLFEGFGMPIVEGQAVGRPVVTSNISPMNEVAGAGAIRVDPTDVNAIKKAYLKVISDEDFRNNVINKGLENVQQYRLQTVAGRYIELYNEIAVK